MAGMRRICAKSGAVRDAVLRARKLLSGFRNPVYRRGLKLGVGASIEHAQALARFRFDVVVDVGANRGQFALFARATWPDCRIVSFEPLAAPAATYERVFAGDAKARLLRAALARERATLTMHVTGAADSSSLLKVGAVQRSAFGTVEVAEEQVPAGPLSDFLAPHELGAKNLLKIDVQGYELEVLKGAESLLSRLAAIYCECSYVELYEGQALFGDITAYLRDRGFEAAGVFNQAEVGGRPLQADVLFERSELRA